MKLILLLLLCSLHVSTISGQSEKSDNLNEENRILYVLGNDGNHRVVKRSAFVWGDEAIQKLYPKISSGDEIIYGGSVDFNGQLGNGKTLTGNFGGFHSESGTMGKNTYGDDGGLLTNWNPILNFGNYPSESLYRLQSINYNQMYPYEYNIPFDNRKMTELTFDDFYKNPRIFYKNRKQEEENKPGIVQSNKYHVNG